MTSFSTISLREDAQHHEFAALFWRHDRTHVFRGVRVKPAPAGEDDAVRRDRRRAAAPPLVVERKSGSVERHTGDSQVVNVPLVFARFERSYRLAKFFP